METWSWIIFGSIALLTIVEYYASVTNPNYYTMTPVAILYVFKIISILVFGIISGMAAFIGIAIIEIIIVLISILRIRKVQNDYQ